MPPARISPRVAAVVAAGGALGALARSGLQPLGPTVAVILAINVVGSLALGALTGWAAARHPRNRYLRPFLGTGVLGGFTTFSTVSVQTRALLAAGRPGPALAYTLGTLALAVAAAWLGLILAERATR